VTGQGWCLGDRSLSGLLRGDGNLETMKVLGAARRSRNLLLLRGLLDIAELDAAPAARIARLGDNFAALAAVESANPNQSARLIAHPHMGAWLVTCFKQIISRHGEEFPRPLWADLGHLGAIAVAAAIAAKVEVEAAVPASSGVVNIPTVGDIHVGDVPTWKMTTVRRLRDGTLTIASAGARVTVRVRAPEWHLHLREVRNLKASANGLDVALELEDLNPYRDIHRLGASDRLPKGDVEKWQQKLTDAWAILASRHRGTAESIAQELYALVPLTPRGRSGVSATSRHAPGAVALTPPRDGTRFACTLVHELQHTKLCLLMELAPLRDVASGQLFYSPWRDDPRPLTGLLHGLYAGIAVAEFWRIENQSGRGGPVAAFQFARTRRQVEAALSSLSSLTPPEDASAALMTAVRDVATLSSDAPVAPRCAQLADDITLDHAVRWRLRNLTPSPRDVDLLAASWRAGTPPAMVSDLGTWSDGGESFTEDSRLSMAHATLLSEHPTGTSPKSTMAEVIDAASPDARLLVGDYEAAAHAFEYDITAEIHPAEAWSGLAVALHGQSDQAAAPLTLRPELVRAVYERVAINASLPPSPVELARWMAPLTANPAD
jgi:HEXXH motif-containing protein